jgi:hypothetical protein
MEETLVDGIDLLGEAGATSDTAIGADTSAAGACGADGSSGVDASAAGPCGADVSSDLAGEIIAGTIPAFFERVRCAGADSKLKNALKSPAAGGIRVNGKTAPPALNQPHGVFVNQCGRCKTYHPKDNVYFSGRNNAQTKCKGCVKIDNKVRAVKKCSGGAFCKEWDSMDKSTLTEFMAMVSDMEDTSDLASVMTIVCQMKKKRTFGGVQWWQRQVFANKLLLRHHAFHHGAMRQHQVALSTAA